jgi:hypothetical protein
MRADEQCVRFSTQNQHIRAKSSSSIRIEVILIHEIRCQPVRTRDIKIKFWNEALQRRCGVQLRDTQNRRIANAPAESLHIVTVAWLLQTGRVESGVAASLRS